MILAILLALGQTGQATCTAIDGDTLRCVDIRTHQSVKIRLNGIDAPERNGTCRYTQKCGNPRYSTNALSRQVSGRTINYEQLDLDRYRRIIASVKTNGTDISCKQVENGYAVYVRKYDEHRTLYNSCSYIRRHYRWNGKKAGN